MMTPRSATFIALLVATLNTHSSSVRAQTSKSPKPFDVVSVHASRDDESLSFGDVANGFSARHTPLSWIILEAYSTEPLSFMRPSQILNAPEWVFKEPFDIEAHVDEKTAEALKSASAEQRMDILRPMLQAFLRDRCGIIVHRQERQDPAYALVSTAHLKLKPSRQSEQPEPNGIAVGDGAYMYYLLLSDTRGFRFHNISLPQFAEVLSGLGAELDLPIVDRTELPGRYDFTLMRLDGGSSGDQANPVPATRYDIGGIGLSLKRTSRAVSFIVVDHIQMPSPN